VAVGAAPGTCQPLLVRPSGDPVASHNGPALSNCVHAQPSKPERVTMNHRYSYLSSATSLG
jgi:hypothetical protein